MAGRKAAAPAEEVVIHAGNADEHQTWKRRAKGLVPRDYAAHPVGYLKCAPPFHAIDLPLIPRSEWADRIKDMEATKSRISDMRLVGNAGQIIPSLDQDGKGYCFPPGTRVRMGDGSVKKIEDVRLLDEVLTAEGNVRRVMQCHVREHDGEMVTVKAWGHGHLRLTPNHEVLTRRGYVPSGDLTADDWIAVPLFAPRRNAVVQTADHVRGARRRARRLEASETSRWETRPAGPADRGYKPVPDFIRLTPGVGRLLGLWLAEGHIDESTGSVVWSFGADETHTLAEETAGLLNGEWHVGSRTRPGPGPNVTQVVLTGVLWCQLFRSLCGSLAGGKRLHPDLAGGPTDFLKALFEGWMDGDGCSRGRRGKAYRCGATISHDLALGMYDVANALGLAPSIICEPPQRNRHARTRQPVWKVQVNPTPSAYRPDYRHRAEEGRVWRKVRHVERQAYRGTVYNIGVEGDNSYVAEGVGVHNCWAHSSTSATMMLRCVANLPYVALSAYAIACVIKNYRDEGGWGAQSLDFITAKGVPSAEFWPMQSMSRSNDKPETWENAAKHKVTEGWVDLQAAQYDRALTFDQVMTLLLSRVPVVVDYNWWSHSVCAIDPVITAGMDFRQRSGKKADLKMMNAALEETGGFGTRDLNSWGDGWSDRGMGVITGAHAVPDGSVAPRSTLATAA